MKNSKNYVKYVPIKGISGIYSSCMPYGMALEECQSLSNAHALRWAERSTKCSYGVGPERQHTPPLDEVRHFDRPRDGTASPLVECICHPSSSPLRLEQLRRHRD